jgi:transposase
MARYGRLLTDAQWEKIRPLLPPVRIPARRATTGERSQSPRRHFVDFAQRRSLAGPARRVSLTNNVLAATSGLGRAKHLAHHLACIPGGTEPTRATQLERIVSGRQFRSGQKRGSQVGKTKRGKGTKWMVVDWGRTFIVAAEAI